jgi:hypothetical protein
MKHVGYTIILVIVVLLSAGSRPATADGLVVDKIYHPYVDAMEKEIEVRSVFQDDQPALTNKAQVHQFSIGTSLSDRLFAEFYLVGGKDRARGFETEALEAELKWQLTEQGEYSADWGLLFEYEDEFRDDIREFSIGLLAEKEFGNFSGAMNFLVIREWGSSIVSEYETALNSQFRYRYSAMFEPGVEMYIGQNTRALGPVVQGNFTTGIRKVLHWEAGVIFGLDSESADVTFRLLTEYEF